MKTGWRDIVGRCLIVVVLTTHAFGFKIPDALAFTNGQNATEVLGQTDGGFPNPGPNFTKNSANDDQDGLYGYGYNDVTDTEIDNVHHRLFVADPQNTRVLEYDLNTDNTLPDSTPDHVIGQPDFLTQNGGTSSTLLSSPFGLAYDPTGDRLFVADKYNDRILVYDTATIVDGEAAVHVLGQADMNSNNAATPTQTGLFQPEDAVFDGTDKLYVSDSSNGRVMVYDVSSITDGEAAVNVLGQVNFTSNVYATTDVNMQNPVGLAYDASGKRLFVADNYGYRVLVFDVNSISDGEAAVNVLGQNDFTSTNYGVSATRVGNPISVAYDASGNRLFVSDVDNNRVLAFDVASITNGEAAVNVLGQPNFTSSVNNDGPAGLYRADGISYGGGRLYVSDDNNARVMIFDVASITDGEDAVDLVGQTMFSYQSYDPADPGYGFYQPGGSALDDVNHRFFVADRLNNRVVVYDLNADNTFVDRRQDHVLGQPSLRHSAQGTTQSTLKQPEGVAYDGTGNRLFVADTGNNRVIVYDVASITDGENASKVLGQALFTTSSATTTQWGLSTPVNLSYVPASGQLLVEDAGNNRVLVFDVASITDGENAVSVIGQPNFTSSAADGGPGTSGFNTPYEVVLDSAHHRLFVADANNERVLVYALDSSDALVDKIPDFVLGEPDFSSTIGGSITSAYTLNGPNGLAYDPTGDRLFVGDSGNNRIMVFDTASITNGEPAVNVLAQANFTSVTFGNLNAAGHYNVGVMEYDGNHNYLYAADFGNSRVKVYDVASITNNENAVNVLGQPNFTTADWGTPSQANLSHPDGVAFDATHNKLYVSDTGYNRVIVYDVASISNGENAVSVLGQSNFTSQGSSGPNQSSLSSPHGITVDGSGNRLFVGDVSALRVMVFDVASITNGENAVNVLGAYDFTSYGTNDLSSSRIGAPGDMWYASSNSKLYVADQNYNRVLIYDVASIADGESAFDLLGQDDYSSIGTNGSANADGLEAASASVVDPVHHRLFVADSANHRVLVYDLNGSDALPDTTPDKVLGHATFGSTAYDPGQAGFQGYPSGLAYDGVNDMLMVSDTDGNRVLVFDVASITNGENAVNVLGQSDFVTFSSNTTVSGLSGPKALTYDEDNGALYVTDKTNNRLTVFGGATMGGGPTPTNDPTLSNAIRMTRLKAGVPSEVDISFVLQNTLDGTFTATFPVGFAVTGAFTSGSCSGGGTVDTFGFNGPSRTLTAEKHSCAGTLSLSGATVTNPGTPGAYQITWVNDDPGGGQIYILDDDQVTVTADVTATLTFDIDIQTSCGSESAAPYALALGTLSPSGVTTASSKICLDLDTNASTGAFVTVQGSGSQDGLESAGTGGSVVTTYAAGAGGQTDLVAGTAGYGLCVESTSAVTGSATGVAPYNGVCNGTSGNRVGGVDSAAPQRILTTNDAVIDGTPNNTAAIRVKASISTTTASANDYTDVLTFVATGTF